MIAQTVEQESVTLCAEVKAPPAGLNVGVATADGSGCCVLMVYVSETASLDAILTLAGGKAFAVIVVVEETSIGAV